MDVQIDDIIKAAKKYKAVSDDRKLRKAYRFSAKAHHGQKRKTGEDYISHPLGVAFMLTRYKADEDTLIAALLHDVVEDTDHDIGEIEHLFGKTIGNMVDGLTKLPRVNTTNNGEVDRDEYKRLTIESLRKMLDVMQKDVRVVVIKLVDRLHNMQSLHTFRREKQIRIAQETLDTYVRIAERLCMHEICEELARVAYGFLYPEQFKALEDNLLYKKPSLQELSADICGKLKKSTIGECIVSCDLRDDVDYSIFFKHSLLHQRTVEVLLVLPTIEDCYLSLHTIHSLWTRQRGSFSDSIHTPKSNGFRSLVTSIIRDDDIRVRFHIRTPEMHRYNRWGIMTKCFGGKPIKVNLPWFEDLHQVAEHTREKAESFRTHLDKDIFAEQILVHGPKGSMIALPPRSTALDGAFYHLGNKAFRVRMVLVNDAEVPFAFPVKDGDSLIFALQAEDRFDPAWLDYVDTGRAKSMVMERLKHLDNGEKILIGHRLIERELNRKNYAYLEEFDSRLMSSIAKNLGVSSWNDVLVGVAEETIHLYDVVGTLVRDKHSVEQNTPYTIEVFREADRDLSSLVQLERCIKPECYSFSHVSTTRDNQNFRDVFRIYINPNEVGHLSKRLSSMYPLVSITEYNPRRLIVSSLLIVTLILIWTVNPFVTKYVLAYGMSSVDLAGIRQIAGALTLILIHVFRYLYLGERLNRLRFTPLFWLATVLVGISALVTNLSLALIPSTNYITVIGVVYLYLILLSSYSAAKDHPSLSSTFHLGAPSVLVLLSFLFLFYSFPTAPLIKGHILALVALFILFWYLFLNHRYQKREKVKNRGLVLVAFMFLFSAMAYLPFLQFDMIVKMPGHIVLLAVLKGVIVGGLGHFIYFWVSRYVRGTTLITWLLIIPFLVILGDIFVAQTPQIPYVSFLLLLIAFIYALMYSRKVQATCINEQINL